MGISGNTTLNNTTVNGSGVNGSGVDINGNLSNTGNTTIGGNANGSGPGVNINGSVNGGQISGNATGDGNGVNISGNITDGNISGSATTGNGVEITGPSAMINTTLSGSSVSGKDIAISAPLLLQGNTPDAAAQRQHQRNQAAMRATLAEGSDVVESAGYRAAPQTQTISVCDDGKNCTRTTVQSAGPDVHPPHRHTGVVAEPLSRDSAKNR
ncbi:putative adhesin [Escherichia coli TA447]|uniref:Putative adhesin n=1 Tax=Escherichia coli TA447 TaxID=656447 RepID=A0A1X3ITR4_ECOLX|nr:putative adhesin [Escherichia coli TA447]